jgi:hypothetical protein
VVAILDRGEDGGIAVPARTRAVGRKQTMPRRGTCRTVRGFGLTVTVWDEAVDGLRRKGASAVDRMRGVAAAGKPWFRGAV